jgi:hypothetical protein
MENNEQLHLARVHQVDQVHAASRSSARATLPPAGCWHCWVLAGLLGQPRMRHTHLLRRLSTCSRPNASCTYYRLYRHAHARVSSKRSPEAGRKKHYCFVLFRFLTVAGPPGGFSSAIANTVRLVGVAVPRVQVQR